MNKFAQHPSGVYLAALLLSTVAMVAGCSTPTTNIGAHAVASDTQGVVNAFKESHRSYMALKLRDHFRVCEALVETRDFERFFACHRALTTRMEDPEVLLPEPMWVVDDGAPTRSRPYSEFSVALLKAQAYHYLGDDETALQLAEAALKIPEAHPFELHVKTDIFSAMAAISSLGVTALSQKMAMDAQIEPTTNAHMARSLGIIGVSAANLGDRERAKVAEKRMAAMTFTGFFAKNWGPVHRAALAKVRMALGDYEGALAAMNVAPESSILSDMGDILIKALGDFGEVDGKAIKQEDTLYALNIESRFMRHRAELETGQLDAARHGYEAILSEPKAKGYGSVLYLAHYGLGRIAVTQRRLEAAIDHFQQAVEVVESQRSSITNERLRISFVGNKQDIYRDLVSTLVDAGRDKEAFSYVERAKSRALVDLLASKKSFGSAAQETRIGGLLANLDTESTTITPGTRGVVIKARQQIARAEPRLLPLVSVSAPDLEQLKMTLRDDETLVEYFGDDQAFFAFVMNRNDIHAHRLDANGLDKNIRQLRDLIAHQENPELKRTSNQLFDQLIRPLEKTLSKRLIIVPHGILHYLPFAALQKADRFLIEDHTISTLPSASVMEFLKAPSTTGSVSALVFGNPDLGRAELDLPGAEAESREIASIFPGARLLVRRDASESAAKALSANARYIHFATHGHFDAEKPLESGLLMHPDTNNDGRLTVTELFDLDLKADLVTLSACDTALGRISSGDDVVGFTRGLMYAGASSIVSSLWPVDDQATRTLMTSFYRHLQAGEPKAQALRSSQLALRSTYPNPYYWAAFQLYGSP